MLNTINLKNKILPFIADSGLRMYDWGSCCKSFNAIKERFCAQLYLNCLIEVPFFLKHIVFVILDYTPVVAIVCSKAREVFSQNIFGVGHRGFADRIIEEKSDAVKLKMNLMYMDGQKFELEMDQKDIVLDLKKAIAGLLDGHWCDFHLFIKGCEDYLADALELNSLAAVDGVIPLFLIPRENKDKEVLMELFRDSTGNTLSGSSSWDVNLSLDQWDGVTLDKGGRVIRLELKRCVGWKITISSKIGNLSALEVLKLENMELVGSIPSEIGELSELKFLSLKFNFLAGSIPSEIYGLFKLQRLNLESNSLTGSLPSEIGRLSKLQSVRVSNNLLEEWIPPEIWQLTNLTEFSLYSTRNTYYRAD